MCTSEIDTANSDEPVDIDTFINNAAWAIHKTYHKILKASPGAAQHSNMTQSLMSRLQLTGTLENRRCQIDPSNTAIIKLAKDINP